MLPSQLPLPKDINDSEQRLASSMPATSALHRVFNQMLLSRRAMTDDMTLEMYKRAVAAVTGES